MPRIEFEPMFPVFEKTTFHALDRAVTVIGSSQLNDHLITQRDKFIVNLVTMP
jgi:hypothetical protein